MFRKVLLGTIALYSGILCSTLSAQVAIVNAASFTAGEPVTAGSWAAAFGTFSGAGGGTTIPAPPFPTTVAGVKLTIEGVECPLYDVRQSQITFLVPGSITAGLHPVVVTTPSGTFRDNVRVMTAAPGIFAKPNGTGALLKGAILNQAGPENTAALPAARGEIISIYGTGPGAFDRSFTDGAAPGSTPLANTKSTPQVFIGGVPATVQFSGLNPFSPGLWQVNVTIPNLAFITGQVPVTLFVDGVQSNEVALFVK